MNMANTNRIAFTNAIHAAEVTRDFYVALDLCGVTDFDHVDQVERESAVLRLRQYGRHIDKGTRE